MGLRRVGFGIWRRLECNSHKLRYGTTLDQVSIQALRDDREFILSKKFTGLLRICAEKQDIANGKAFHTHILKTIPNPDIFLYNSLANMYSKCRFLQDARYVFEQIPQPDVVSWNIIIDGYFLSGFRSDGFACFAEMMYSGVAPDEFSFTSVLKSCVGYRDFSRGLLVHCVIIKYGLDSSAFVGNGLVEFYANFNFLIESMKVFEMVEFKDTVLVSTVIGILAKVGDFREAFVKFQHILTSSMVPTRAIFVSLLSAIDGYEVWRQGVQVHGLVIKFGFEGDGAVQNSLVRMYSNCDCIDNAHDLLIYLGSKSIISWTTLINGYANHGRVQDAMDAFDWIYHEAGTLDNILLACTLAIVASSECFQLGTQIHSVIFKSGFDSDPCITHALMDMYAKCMFMEDALKLFKEIGHIRDVLSWTTVISGNVHNGFNTEALRSFCQMNREGINPDSVACISVLMGCINLHAINQGEQVHAFVIKSGCETDISVQTVLLCLYSDCGSFYAVLRLFGMMVSHDVVSWTALVSAYAKHGYSEEALIWLVNMLRDGVKPNQFTLSSALTASAKLTATETGKSLHSLIIKTGSEEDKFVGSALIDMYSKCGNIVSAVSYFMGRSKHDLILWNALLAGHAQHGNVVELLKAYEEMHDHGVKPDGVTFIAVLTGCSHGGLVDKLIQYYFAMHHEYGISPGMEHCACIIDGLGRACMFKEAVDFIQGKEFKIGSEVLRALISSCIFHGFVQLGLATIAKMVVSGQNDSTTYVLLSNLYAVDGRWVNARRVREAMDSGCINGKKVGKSWIESKSCMVR